MAQAVVSLHNAAPQEFRAFVDQLRAMTAQSTLDMVKCQPEFVHKAQGRALAFTELVEAIIDAPNVVDDARKRAATAQRGAQHGRPGTQHHA